MNKTIDMVDTRATDDDDTFQLLTILWSRKWWIILSAIVFGLIGFAYAMTQAPQYRAEALVQLETRSSGVQLSADIAEMLSPESEASTEIEIIKSRLVLGQVVEALSLDVEARPVQVPVFGNFLSRYEIPQPDWPIFEGIAWYAEKITVEALSTPENWIGSALEITYKGDDSFTVQTPEGNIFAGIVGLALEDTNGFSLTISELSGREGSRFTVARISQMAAVNAIRSNLGVSEKARSTGILSVAMTSPSGALSEAIVAETVQAYVDQNIGRSAEEAERSLQFLQEQIPIVQSQLATAEQVLNAFRLESESIDLNYEAQSILERSVSLDSQISGLSLEETELSRRYTPNHPTYRALLEKKQRLLEEKETLGSSVKNLPLTQQQILSKTRDVDVSQQIYLQLLNKSQELNVMKAGAVGNVRLIDPAAANPVAVAPKIPLATALGMLMGGVAAAAFILLKYNMSRVVDSPEDLARLSIPIFAVVPLSANQMRATKRQEFSLLAREHPTELAVEALRSLRTSLHFGLQDRDRNIVCITGPSPTIGKSFVSSNLAFLAAQSGVKVLVVDGDMRRGNLGKHFRVPQDLPGLAQILDGSRTPSSVMYEVDLEHLNIINQQKVKRRHATGRKIRKLVADIDSEFELSEDTRTNDRPSGRTVHEEASALATITVVPRGQAPDNPSELLMHSRFPEFLEQASQDFDLVIVDTPPVLAATDAMIIGKYSDMCLMVVRQGETTTHEAEEIVRSFENSRTRFNGIVLNGYNAQHGKYGKYGTQYGYRYNY